MLSCFCALNHCTPLAGKSKAKSSAGDGLGLDYPGRLVQIAEDKLVCPDMKRTTVDTLLAAMEGRGGEVIEMDAALMDAARASLTNMITLGA